MSLQHSRLHFLVYIIGHISLNLNEFTITLLTKARAVQYAEINTKILLVIYRQGKQICIVAQIRTNDKYGVRGG
jgi:hypothetical protein